MIKVNNKNIIKEAEAVESTEINLQDKTSETNTVEASSKTILL